MSDQLVNRSQVTSDHTISPVGPWLAEIKKGVQCWEVHEDTKTDFWEILLPEITNYLEGVFGADPSPNCLTVTLYMIGKKPESASPTILFISESSSDRKSARCAIKKSHILDRHRGFKTMPISKDPGLAKLKQLAASCGPLPKTSVPSEEEVLFDATQPLRTHGLPVHVSHGTSLRTATANFLRVSDRIYYQTVYHVFSRCPPLFDESVVDSDPGYDIDSCSEFDFDAEYDMDIDTIDGLDDPFENEESKMIGIDAPQPPQMDSLAVLGNLAHYSQENDCALIEITHNEVLRFLSQASTIASFAERVPLEVPKTTGASDSCVYTITATRREVLPGKISSLASSMRLPHSTVFRDVHKVHFEKAIRQGDSGSIILDVGSGFAYGHLIAGCTTTNIGYLIAGHHMTAFIARVSERVKDHVPTCLQTTPHSPPSAHPGHEKSCSGIMEEVNSSNGFEKPNENGHLCLSQIEPFELLGELNRRVGPTEWPFPKQFPKFPNVERRVICIPDLSLEKIGQIMSFSMEKKMDSGFEEHIAALNEAVTEYDPHGPRSSMRVNVSSSTKQSFRLQLHVPYITLKKVDESDPSARGAEKVLYRDIKYYLELPSAYEIQDDRIDRYVIEVSTSSLIVWGNQEWVGYAFNRCPAGIFEGGIGNEETSDNGSADATNVHETALLLTDLKSSMSDIETTLLDPRQYWLCVAESRMQFGVAQWTRAVEEFEDIYKFREPCIDLGAGEDRPRYFQKAYDNIMKTDDLLQVFKPSLHGILGLWERFNESDGDKNYFSDISDGPGRTALGNIKISFERLTRLQDRLQKLEERGSDSIKKVLLQMNFESNRLNLESQRLNHKNIQLSLETASLARKGNYISFKTQELGLASYKAAETTRRVLSLNAEILLATTPIAIVLQYFSAEKEILYFERSTRNFFLSIFIVGIGLRLLTFVIYRLEYIRQRLLSRMFKLRGYRRDEDEYVLVDQKV